MTAIESTDDVVLRYLRHHVESGGALPINAPSLRWMVEHERPDLTIGNVLTSFRSLAAAGLVQLLQRDECERPMGVVSALN